jgi:hypothetical protein
MKTYDIDGDGYLVGAANPDRGTPGPVSVAPEGIPPSRARWNGTAWIEDASREQAAAVAALMASVAAEIQRRLNALAVAWGYDSMLSLVTYRESSIPQFSAEAEAGAAWRDAAWAYAEAAKTTNPTPEQFWAGFPATPTRPA